MRKLGSVTLSLLLCLAVIVILPSPVSVSALSVEVTLGGYPVAIEMLSDGPIVKSVTENYATSGEIKVGDVIKRINGVDIGSRHDLTTLMLSENLEIPLTVELMRRDAPVSVRLMPERDVCSEKLKLGFQVKDGVSGVGTVTCVYNGHFYALGHPISDSDSTSKFVCRSGEIYRCEVCGIEKPITGKAGKIIGKCTDGAHPIGRIRENSACGLRGDVLQPSEGDLCTTLPRENVRPGKAQIYTTVNGAPQYFDIEIVKASRQSSSDEKGMVIHVTDDALLNLAGGILQGMSGSPILQDGKLAGAVTHVFTNDPTRGYGIYADWILAA